MNLRSTCIIRGGWGEVGKSFNHRCSVLGQNLPATRMGKYALRQSAAKCIVITKDFNAVRDLRAFWRIYLTSLPAQQPVVIASVKTWCFTFSSTSFSPLAPPPLFWSKWLREAPLMKALSLHHNVKTLGMGGDERQLPSVIQTGGPCWAAGLKHRLCSAASPSLPCSQETALGWTRGVTRH